MIWGWILDRLDALGRSKRAHRARTDPFAEHGQVELGDGQFDAVLEDLGWALEFTDFICECYDLRGRFALSDIDAFVRQQRANHPGYVLLATLDDTHQATYTSFHAALKYGLDNSAGHDLAGLTPAQLNYSSPTDPCELVRSFKVRHANFLAMLQADDDTDVTGKGWWLDAGDVGEPTPSLLINTDFQARTAIAETLVQLVPVQHGYEAISAQPNGYFKGDFTPAQNYALAKHLQERFELVLFGIGASYLGFQADAPLEDDQLGELGDLITTIYTNAPPAEDIVERLRGQTTIYLAYAGW